MTRSKNGIILNPGFTRAVKAYHNQAGLAAALRTGKSTVSNWIMRGKVPPEWAFAIIHLPNCRPLKLRIEDICPYLKDAIVRHDVEIAV